MICSVSCEKCSRLSRLLSRAAAKKVPAAGEPASFPLTREGNLIMMGIARGALAEMVRNY